MKCEVCGKKVTWDGSVGKREYLVCTPCFDDMARINNYDYSGTLMEIFKCADKKKEKRK